ncbi:hypothetical protein [Vescimonas sp.]|uniref:hypothetical protein n=1 Tax=Vescimonas sp. TaxID=2892404 RepID=UPI0030794ED6
MKKFRKLIPALCMLLVSALFVGTSTYAWFSMNTKVTADNMKVTAVADNPYLQISKTDSKSGFDTSVSLDMAATKALKLITPLNVNADAAANSYFDTNGTNEGVLASKATKPADLIWGYATSTKTSESQGTNKTTKMDATKADDYYVVDEMWLKVADEGANGYNLTAACEFTKGANTIANSVRVLLITDDGKYVIFKADGTTVDGNAKLADVLTAKKTGGVPGDVLHVTAYMYFDGTHADAYTDKATNLSEVSAKLTYTVEVTPTVGP